MNVYGHLFPSGLDALAADLDAARSAVRPVPRTVVGLREEASVRRA
jgi:cob(I)alamin adenosyltransferase